MIDEDLSGLPRSALRDYSEDTRLDRVWSRLESGFKRRPRRSRSSWPLLPALGLLVFASGILVGRHVVPLSPEAPPEVLAEEIAPPSEAPRSALLPGAQTREERSRPPVPVTSSRRRPSVARAPVVATPSPAASETAAEKQDALLEAYAVEAPLGPPEWLSLAEAGDFEAARLALAGEGGFDAVISTASPDQLLVLGDVARASGDRDHALRALRQLLERHPGAPEAPVAAWTLGNVLEQGGDSSGAAEAFALYRRLSPAGDFAEDAAARQVHVALTQGNVELALGLLDEYAKDFPNGRRLSELREELEKLQLGAAEAEESVPPSSDTESAREELEPSRAPAVP